MEMGDFLHPKFLVQYTLKNKEIGPYLGCSEECVLARKLRWNKAWIMTQGTYNRKVGSIHVGKPPDISLYDKSLYAKTY